MALSLGQCPSHSTLAEAGSQPLHLVKSLLGLCNQITKELAGRFLEICSKSSFTSLLPIPMAVRTVLPPLFIHHLPPDPKLETSKLPGLPTCQGRQTKGKIPQEHAMRTAEDQSMTTLLQEVVTVESDLVM